MNTDKEPAPRKRPRPAEDRWLYDDPGNEDPGSQLDGQVPLQPPAEPGKSERPAPPKRGSAAPRRR